MENKLTVIINKTELPIKEYQGQRVVTMKEIDAVHQRPEGTARKRFNDNKVHFIEGVDYFNVTQPSEIRTLGLERPQGGTPESVTLITESGYLMLVKSFTDDLAWAVQRQLVNTYFRAHGVTPDLDALSPTLRVLINLELEQKAQAKAIEAVNQKIDDIRDVVALSPNAWRPNTRSLIARIARALGGNEYIRDVQAEIYKLVDERARVSLETRLTNKRRRMADEGVCKSRRDKLTKVDIIADDAKLIEIYIAVVKEMCVKYGIAVNEETIDGKRD